MRLQLSWIECQTPTLKVVRSNRIRRTTRLSLGAIRVRTLFFFWAQFSRLLRVSFFVAQTQTCGQQFATAGFFFILKVVCPRLQRYLFCKRLPKAQSSLLWRQCFLCRRDSNPESVSGVKKTCRRHVLSREVRSSYAARTDSARQSHCAVIPPGGPSKNARNSRFFQLFRAFLFGNLFSI